jgi:hypothetical protein
MTNGKIKGPRLSPLELQLINQIAERGRMMYLRAKLDVPIWQIEGELMLAHKKRPLRLGELAQADDFNFAHDVIGIRNHINLETGEMSDHFLPRFSR